MKLDTVARIKASLISIAIGAIILLANRFISPLIDFALLLYLVGAAFIIIGGVGYLVNTNIRDQKEKEQEK